MINTGELRIGNKVGFYKPLKQDLQIGTVSELSLEEVLVPEFSENVAINPNGLVPIELIEKILPKFGFKQNGNDKRYFAWSELYFIDKTPFGELALYMNLKYPVVIRKLDFVHNLQNLYFSLTACELEIKL